MLNWILTILLGIIAFLTFNLGVDYMMLGHGLHPAIAYPMALGSFGSACYISGMFR